LAEKERGKKKLAGDVGRMKHGAKVDYHDELAVVDGGYGDYDDEDWGEEGDWNEEEYYTQPHHH
jgi:hypothetical protein